MINILNLKRYLAIVLLIKFFQKCSETSKIALKLDLPLRTKSRKIPIYDFQPTFLTLWGSFMPNTSARSEKSNIDQEPILLCTDFRPTIL